MAIGWPTFYVFLFIYRCAYSALAFFVVSRLTGLGDVARIISADFTAIDVVQLGADPLQGSRGIAIVIAQNLGRLFKILSFGNELLIFMFFQAVAFVGLVKFLMSLEPKFRKRVALILLFPSFSVWSSIPGKEAIVVFAVGVSCSYVVDMYYNREKLSVLHIVAFAALAIFKLPYVIAFIFLIGVSKIAYRVRQKAFVALAVGIVSLVPLYTFRDKIDALSFEVIRHFNVGFGRMTREPYWTEQYDVFWKAPYGMFQSFFGPTLSEAATGILQISSFIESTILVAMFLFFLLKRLPEVPVYNFILGLFTTFWILFSTYPLGIMNPGSAIRYRTGYLVLVVFIFTFLTSREVYASWLAGTPGRGGNAKPVLGPSQGRV